MYIALIIIITVRGITETQFDIQMLLNTHTTSKLPTTQCVTDISCSRGAHHAVGAQVWITQGVSQLSEHTSLVNCQQLLKHHIDTHRVYNDMVNNIASLSFDQHPSSHQPTIPQHYHHGRRIQCTVPDQSSQQGFPSGLFSGHPHEPQD